MLSHHPKALHILCAVALIALPILATAQQIGGLSVTPKTLIGGSGATGTVTLSKPAGSSGLKVKLASSSTLVSLSTTTLMIPSGATSGTFSLMVGPVLAAAKVTISGKDPTGKVASAAISLSPPTVRLSKLTIKPTVIGSPDSATGTLMLTGSAPTEGFVVKLSSLQTFISVPSSVTVSGGAKSATFIIGASPVNRNQLATVVALDPNGYKSSATLMVDVPAIHLSGIVLNPSSVVAPSAASGTVTLNTNAPASGFVVNISGSASLVTVPQSVTVKAGTKSATFAIGSLPISTAATTPIKAQDAYGNAYSANLSIKLPAIRLVSVSVSPASITGGDPAIGILTLSAPAPTGGWVVQLSSSQSSVTVPKSATVSAGSMVGNFSIASANVAEATSVAIKATDPNGYTSTGNLGIVPHVGNGISMTLSNSFSPMTLTVAAGETVTWTNNGSMAHTAQTDLTPGGFLSGNVLKGATFSWVVPADTKSGTKFYYHCAYHGFPGNGSTFGTGMVGVIIVK